MSLCYVRCYGDLHIARNVVANPEYNDEIKSGDDNNNAFRYVTTTIAFLFSLENAKAYSILCNALYSLYKSE